LHGLNNCLTDRLGQAHLQSGSPINPLDRLALDLPGPTSTAMLQDHANLKSVMGEVMRDLLSTVGQPFVQILGV
jgi:hypothetical protein